MITKGDCLSHRLLRSCINTAINDNGSGSVAATSGGSSSAAAKYVLRPLYPLLSITHQSFITSATTTPAGSGSTTASSSSSTASKTNAAAVGSSASTFGIAS